MLSNLVDLLNWAEEENRAVGAFNIYNLETILAVVDGGEKTGKPVILSFGESYFSHGPIEAVAAAARQIIEQASVPVGLHLDHARETESVVRAIECGFTSVMFDGSHLPFEENMEKTKAVCAFAHQRGVGVEGELGYLNSEGGELMDQGSLRLGYTRADQAGEFVRYTGVDALAVAIGNAHGIYQREPHLDFQRLREIRREAKLPIVLHGCSGIPLEMIRQSVRLGVRKINVNTELALTGVKAIEQWLAASKGPLRLEKAMVQARKAMASVVGEYIHGITQ